MVGDRSSTRLFSATFENWTATVRQDLHGLSSLPLYLRLTRSGDLWSLEYAYDGVNWQDAGSFTCAMTVNSVGLYAGNAGSTAPAHTTLVDYFQVGSASFSDSTAPHISDIQVSATDTEATVTWTTDETAEGSLDYGPTSTYENGTVSEGSSGTTHSVTLSGLSAESTYHYQVNSTDAAGNTASSTDLTFTTEPAGTDTTAPVISGIQASVTDTSATITWSTDEAATRSVDYGSTNAYEDGTVSDATLVAAHSLSLTGLTADSTYRYRVNSTDAAGNTSSSVDLTFTTATVSSSGPVSDAFDGSSLDTRLWTVLDPLGDGTFAVSNGQLSLSVPSDSAHNLWKGSNDVLRIMQPTDDVDFSIEVKFDSIVSEQHQFHGILVEQSDGNLLRFDAVGDSGSAQLFAATFENWTATVRQQLDGLASNPLYLRLTRSADQWSLEFSYDGTNWVQAGSFTHAMTATAVGVYAGNAGNPTPAHTAVIDYFQVGRTVSEVGDTRPPAIDNIQVNVTDYDATIAWRTNETSNGSVDYGSTNAYESGSIGEATSGISHSVTLSGLSADSSYHYRVNSADFSGNTSSSMDLTFTTNSLNDGGPLIDAWQGDTQTFSGSGQSQNWTNILGRVTDPDGVSSLSYSLNGQAFQPLTIGANGNRLIARGDFNAELDYRELLPGQNSVTLNATDSLGNTTTQTLTLTANFNDPGLPFAIDWSTVHDVQDVMQVVDGQWETSRSGIRSTVLGYDRILALGDIGWNDYVVTVPVTIHSLDPLCLDGGCPGKPGVGVIVRWQGHYDWDGSQPRTGWWPIGAFGWINWDISTMDARFQLWGSDSTRVATARNQAVSFGETYMVKMLAQTVPGEYHAYRFKVWPSTQPEPLDWMFTHEEPITSLGQGAISLVAHHADVTFGNMTVEPLSPPALSSISVDVSDTSATVTWLTDEPAGSRIEWGLTSSHDSELSDTTRLTSHEFTITGLERGTTYHYSLTSVDADGEIGHSGNLTFTTTSTGSTWRDDFSETSLDPSWQAVDPLGDASFTLTGTQLRIDVTAGAEHNVWRSGNFAPRLMRPAENFDFQIETKLDSYVQSGHQMQGVLIEQDATNFIRIDIYSDGTTTYLFAATFLNGNPAKVFNIPIASSIPLYLQVNRTGDLWEVFYSSDGQAWTAAPDFIYALNVAAAGLFAGNAGSSPPAHSGYFDYFSLYTASLTQ